MARETNKCEEKYSEYHVAISYLIMYEYRLVEVLHRKHLRRVLNSSFNYLLAMFVF